MEENKEYDSKLLDSMEDIYEREKEIYSNDFKQFISDSKKIFNDIRISTESKYIKISDSFSKLCFDDSFKNKLTNPTWQNYFGKITTTENLDFQEVIEKYDSPTTYFYCDPPYYKTENYYANHDFGIETHERLATTLKSIKGKFSLSYYDFDQLSEWFPKNEYRWESKQFSKAAMAKAGKSQTKGTELLIMNY